MVLVVNIGNSNIRFGVFQDNDVIVSWVINTKPYRSADEYFLLFKNMYEQYGIESKQIKSIVMGSVVPAISSLVQKALKKIHGFTPTIVDRNTTSAVRHSSQQMGTDLYANAVAAHAQYKQSCLVVDFGTALTLIGVLTSGEVKGVVIAPGIITSLNALIGDTAQLHDIELKKPKQVLGLDTESCMQSGLIYGYLSMIEGLIERASYEMGEKPLVISTGGLGHIYAPLTESININDRLHTLKGLKVLGQE